jgi:DNA-binding GntR family transcriptional regulator
VEGRPVMYELTFVPNLNLPYFVRRFKLNQSFFEFLAKEYQLEITGMEQQIWAVAAPPFVAQHLRVELNSPVLKISRKYHSNRSHLNLYSILYCNTEKYALGNTSGVLNQSI